MSTGDPDANTTAPTGDLAGSGWQYLGTFGGFLGTAIAPNYFITATHVSGSGAVGSTFVYHGTTFHTTAAYSNRDLTVFRVDGTFDSYAPLYTKAGTEVGLDLVVFGRGTQRGDEYLLPDHTSGGWLWGAGDGRLRWGENTVSSIYTDPTYGSLLYSTFDVGGGPNEAHLSAGDSGGALFVRDLADGIWKLAGINSFVDGYFSESSDGANPFVAALFKTDGLYGSGNSGYEPITGPSGFYASAIAPSYEWISMVTVPEPSTWWLPLGGAVALAGMRKRRTARA